MRPHPGHGRVAVGNVERVVTAGLATVGVVGTVTTSVGLTTPGLAVRGSRKGSESRADSGASRHGEAMEDSG